MKIVLWGIGNNARRLLSQKGVYQNDIIIALIDSDKKKWGKRLDGYTILPPQKVKEIEFDKIVICANAYDEIRKELIAEYQQCGDSICNLDYFYGTLLNRLQDKYNEKNDREAADMIQSFKEKGVSVWGNYEGEEDCYQIYRDDENDPYIIFLGDKRMYFPREYVFAKENGKEVIHNILWEQGENSPHLYVRPEWGEEKLRNGVIVDAGAREGNFALRYANEAKKIYLIESDPSWMKALKKTFYPYQNKVVFSNKLLSREDDRDHIRLDTLVEEKVDFLKMDIEGAEVDAVLGAKKTLKESDALCSICCYHKSTDEENIRFLLETLGYVTSVSKGYMLFLYDMYLLDHLDFRRGMVYAGKTGQ